MAPVLNTTEPLGWPLLPVPDANGQLHYPGLAQSVREQIQVLLSTRPGEQLIGDLALDPALDRNPLGLPVGPDDVWDVVIERGEVKAGVVEEHLWHREVDQHIRAGL